MKKQVEKVRVTRWWDTERDDEKLYGVEAKVDGSWISVRSGNAFLTDNLEVLKVWVNEVNLHLKKGDSSYLKNGCPVFDEALSTPTNVIKPK